MVGLCGCFSAKSSSVEVLAMPYAAEVANYLVKADAIALEIVARMSECQNSTNGPSATLEDYRRVVVELKKADHTNLVVRYHAKHPSEIFGFPETFYVDINPQSGRIEYSPGR